jgi:hypothetical protein
VDWRAEAAAGDVMEACRSARVCEFTIPLSRYSPKFIIQLMWLGLNWEECSSGSTTSEGGVPAAQFSAFVTLWSKVISS